MSHGPGNEPRNVRGAMRGNARGPGVEPSEATIDRISHPNRNRGTNGDRESVWDGDSRSEPHATSGSRVAQHPRRVAQRSDARSSGKRGMHSAAAGGPAPKAPTTAPSHVTDVRFGDMPGLSEPTKRAMLDGFGYERATVVQAATVEPALSGRDMIVRARTGTGKTLGFVIPTVERIKERVRHSDPTTIHCVIVSPTRELASQIAVEAKKLVKYHATGSLRKHFGVQLVVGGTNRNTEEKALNKGPNSILVCTPGRFHDHAENSRGFKEMLSGASVAILDECDTLLEMGFRNEILKLLRMLPPVKNRQTLLFSATMPTSFKEVAREALKKDHDNVDCVGEDTAETATKAEQSALVVPKAEWLLRLVQVIREGTTTPNFKIMVFCNTARTAGYLGGLFEKDDLAGGAGKRNPTIMQIHSRMTQARRTKTSDQFRSASGNAILFSSDVSARGVDYPGVTLVVQLGLPASRETYVHRLGRTARAGEEGKGLLLLCDFEKPYLRKHISDLPVKEVNPEPLPMDAEWLDDVESALRRVPQDKDLKQRADRAYSAWMGYMKGHLKLIGWSREQLVDEANQFARQLGLSRTPELPKKTVGMMGLKGVPGLNIASEMSRQNSGGSPRRRW